MKEESKVSIGEESLTVGSWPHLRFVAAPAYMITFGGFVGTLLTLRAGNWNGLVFLPFLFLGLAILIRPPVRVVLERGVVRYHYGRHRGTLVWNCLERPSRLAPLEWAKRAVDWLSPGVKQVGTVDDRVMRIGWSLGRSAVLEGPTRVELYLGRRARKKIEAFVDIQDRCVGVS